MPTASGPIRSRRAFTSVELLTSIAFLFIALGLMVSLARYVRSASADELTSDILLSLDRLMDQYVAQSGRPPEVPPLLDGPPRDEAEILSRARANNHAFLRAFYSMPAVTTGPLLNLPVSNYDGSSLYDSWGSPIVFMPRMHPAIGMSPKGWFFVSAGPDRRFMTREDNLYSYEGILHP